MGILSFVNKFQHKSEIRESRDEIMIGEVIYLITTHYGWPTISLKATGDFQRVLFRCHDDPIMHSLEVRLDRKTGGGVVTEKLVGSKATLYVKGEVKNFLADPDDLLHMWSTDVKNILKLPVMGQMKLNHELNSIFAQKGGIIEIGNFVLKGEEGRSALKAHLDESITEVREKLKDYKKV